MKKNTFGVNMRACCRAHEAAVIAAMAEGRATAALLDLHREEIRNLQHERLAHLIVTVMVVVCELFVTGLTVLHPELGVLPAVFMLGLAVLLGFYFRHYFFLENTVQRWYVLARELEEETERGE